MIKSDRGEICTNHAKMEGPSYTSKELQVKGEVSHGVCYTIKSLFSQFKKIKNLSAAPGQKGVRTTYQRQRIQ